MWETLTKVDFTSVRRESRTQEGKILQLRVPGGEVALFSIAAPGEAGRANEDAAGVVFDGRGRGLLVVCDGVGGGRHGRKASGLAVDAVCEAAQGEGGIHRGSVLTGIDEANRRVLALGGAATTLTAVEIDERGFRPYQIGDSMVLVVGQRGKLRYHSLAHGPTGYALAAGYLEEDEALHHAHLNIVYNVVGIEEMFIDLGSVLPMSQKDTVLVASDGVFDNMYRQEITNIIRKGPIEKAAHRLYELCQERMLKPQEEAPSKPDDLTFILYRRRSVDLD